MIDGTFIDSIAKQVRRPQRDGEFILYPNDWHVTDQASLVKPGPTAEALKVYSLGALRDYIKANRDTLILDKLIAHVVSPQIVRLSGQIQERARNRETYVEATALNLTDAFLGKWMPSDEFIIGLQTRFARSDDLTAVLRLFSNISHEAVRTSSDDGITQTVTAKVGIALKSDMQVPNPVNLTPFRTFREVTQPPSLFALRVNASMQVGIFEADGGAWRLTAVDRIRDWLVEALADTVAVLA